VREAVGFWVMANAEESAAVFSAGVPDRMCRSVSSMGFREKDASSSLSIGAASKLNTVKNMARRKREVLGKRVMAATFQLKYFYCPELP